MYSEPSNYQSHPLLDGIFSGRSTNIEGLPISSDYSPEPLPILGNDVAAENDAHFAGSLAIDIPGSHSSGHITPSKTFDEAINMSPAAMFLSGFTSPPPSKFALLPDAEGQTVCGYTLGHIIGSGGFSTIRHATHSNGAVVAVKIVRSDPTRKRLLDHESEVWASLRHEHILPLFSVNHTSYADYFFTLFCPAGSLFDILKREGTPAMPQDDAGMMFRQVVRGLVYLHTEAGLVHRDIKLENVLVDEMGVCRIGDFGMARRIGEIDVEDDGHEEEEHSPQLLRTASVVVPKRRSAAHGLLTHPSLRRATRHRNSSPMSRATTAHHSFQPGSLPYAAPELLSPQVTPADPAQDVWAVAILLYALLTGHLPFTDSFEPRLQMKILHGVYNIPSGIGHGAERMFKGCLDRTVETRWTITMVDEVAWGVGWGSEVDDVTAREVEEAVVDAASRSRSRSSRPSVADDWLEEDHPSHTPAFDAAQRRSSSRAQRSLSRAPVLSPSRSTSRPPLQSPISGSYHRHPSLTMMRTMSASSSSTNDSSLYAFSLERGRGRARKIISRSPSPSPTTPPADGISDSRFIRLAEHSRGRRDYGRDLNSMSPRALEADSKLLLLDSVAEKAVLQTSASYGSPSLFDSTTDAPRRPVIGLGILISGASSRRAGSMPPVREEKSPRTLTFVEERQARSRTAAGISGSTRSRSVGCERLGMGYLG